MHCDTPPPTSGRGQPRPTVGAIVRAHGGSFQRQHALSEAQRKVLRAIGACRTPVLGGRLEVCPQCGDEQAVFHSCRNRHCPQCQALRQARWLERRMDRLLPTDYFHVVFTVPDDLLAALAMRNRELFFDALFAAASQTLLALGRDERRLGAQLGITAVLHTWTRDLRFHPHLHCIVTGGGLAADGHWRSTPQDYLFPVSVLSALFRGKLVAALDDAYKRGLLDLRGLRDLDQVADPDVAWRRFRRRLYRSKWVSYAKRPFAGPQAVFQYLGRYTHRVGLSNHRLVAADDDAVTFRTRGDETTTLHPHEFLRRFLLHVLPPGYVKMRHYGLLAPGNVGTRLLTARARLEALPPQPSSPALSIQKHPEPAFEPGSDWRLLLLRLTGFDPALCRKCAGLLTSRPLPRPAPTDTS